MSSSSSSSSSAAARSVVVWFRSDLRVRDNRALEAAAAEAERARLPLVGLYVVSPEQWLDHGMGAPKVTFLLRCVAALRGALAAGPAVPLLVRTAPNLGAGRARHTAAAAGEAAAACAALGASAVFYGAEYEVNERSRDAQFRRAAEEAGVRAEEVHDQCVVRPGTLRTGTDNAYKVYTPFKNKWMAEVRSKRHQPDDYLRLSRPPAVKQELAAAAAALAEEAGGVELPPDSGGVRGYEAPDAALLASVGEGFPAGEAEAHRRLAEFVAARAREYDGRRNSPGDVEGTSRMSPYLAAGVVSPRQCVVAAAAANGGHLDSGSSGIRVWIQEVVWREFYREVLHSFPRVCTGQPFQAWTRLVEWRDDAAGRADLERWRQGRTGYPLVDAGMRELRATGFMHNRCRMVTAMFLTKHLLVHWREGEAHFARYLVDQDFASNNGGWTWSSSAGTDAQPYFRIFSPVRQSERFDPRGDYIRRWVPELASVPLARLHAPWEHLSADELRSIGYCSPVVDHREARERCLAVFRAARAAFDAAKEAAADVSAAAGPGAKRGAGAGRAKSPAGKRTRK